MRITIAERLKPFCHLPGTSLILPGHGYQIQIFPCLIRIYHLKNAIPTLLIEFNLEMKGPVEQFTICNDLEKGRVSVWGKTVMGWMRYHFMSGQAFGGMRLVVERAPEGGLPIYQGKQHYLLHDKEWLDFLNENNPAATFLPYQVPPCDRLSLGNHQAQDWELMRRRLSLKEIFPLWHRLGQLIPSVHSSSDANEGSLSLLEACQNSFLSGKPEDAEQTWINLFLAGFHGMFVPQIEDCHYQGLVPIHPVVSSDNSPLVILSQGANLIRQLFVQQEREKVKILPYLLPSLPFGRLLDVPLEGGGKLSLEWTKKTIRRLILKVTQEQEMRFKFRSDVRSYRLRQHPNDQGERKECSSAIFLNKNCTYFLDNFQ